MCGFSKSPKRSNGASDGSNAANDSNGSNGLVQGAPVMLLKRTGRKRETVDGHLSVSVQTQPPTLKPTPPTPHPTSQNHTAQSRSRATAPDLRLPQCSTSKLTRCTPTPNSPPWWLSSWALSSWDGGISVYAPNS